jgi:FkbM family methyltransferase
MKVFLRKIYELIPFKREVYSVMRVFIKMPKKLHQYFYFTGVFSTTVDGKKFKMKDYGFRFHVENELFWGGIENGWEKTSTNLWVKLCATAQTVFDVGANTGFYSVLAKTIRTDCNVYAFEPLEGILKKLRYNIELNKHDIHCIDFALSNYNGEAKVYPASLDHVYSVTVNKNISTTNEPVFEQTIKTIRLADFIRQNKIDNIDLMKIDVETHEVEVLEGMGEYLKIMQPDMLIEIQTDEIALGIEKLIEGIDYLFFNINEKTGVTHVKKLGKSDTLNYLVCKRQTAQRLNLI